MDKILRRKGADRSWPANGSTVTQGVLMQFNDGNNYSDRMTPEAGRGPDLRALAVLDALGLLDDVGCFTMAFFIIIVKNYIKSSSHRYIG